MVQWLGLHASTAGGTGLIPGLGTKIPTWTNQFLSDLAFSEPSLLSHRTYPADWTSPPSIQRSLSLQDHEATGLSFPFWINQFAKSPDLPAKHPYVWSNAWTAIQIGLLLGPGAGWHQRESLLVHIMKVKKKKKPLTCPMPSTEVSTRMRAQAASFIISV